MNGIDMSGLLAYMMPILCMLFLGVVLLISGGVALIQARRQHTRVREQPAYNHVVGAAVSGSCNLIAWLAIAGVLHRDAPADLRSMLDQAAIQWALITLGLWPVIAALRSRWSCRASS